MAHQRTLSRRLKPKPRRVCENTQNAVELMLDLDWSPEQISAICTRIGFPVSHEWIYNYVLADFNDGGSLFAHLRYRLKRYKKRLRSDIHLTMLDSFPNAFEFFNKSRDFLENRLLLCPILRV